MAVQLPGGRVPLVGEYKEPIDQAAAERQKTSKKCCEVFKRYCTIGANLLFGLGLEGVGMACLIVGSGGTTKAAGLLFMGLGTFFLGDAYSAIRTNFPARTNI